jgi:hypothetical protein
MDTICGKNSPVNCETLFVWGSRNFCRHSGQVVVMAEIVVMVRVEVEITILVIIFFLRLCSPILDLGRLQESFRFISVTWSRTVGRTPWTGDQLVARPLRVCPGWLCDGEVGGMNGFWQGKPKYSENYIGYNNNNNNNCRSGSSSSSSSNSISSDNGSTSRPLKQLVAGFPPRRPGFAPRSGKWNLWWTKWRWGRFSPSTSVSKQLKIYLRNVKLIMFLFSNVGIVTCSGQFKDRLWIGWLDLLTPYTSTQLLTTGNTEVSLIYTHHSSPLHTH